MVVFFRRRIIDGLRLAIQFRNVLAKVIGTTNPVNVARATVAGLTGLRNPRQVAIRRGKSLEELRGQESADE